MLASAVALAGAVSTSRLAAGQEATPTGGEWTFTDVLGNTVTLPQWPQRIAADISTAAALWDFGVEAQTVFGWTAVNHSDGDHVAWGNIDLDLVEIVGDAEGAVEVEALLAQQPDLIVTWIWDKDNPASSHVAIPEDRIEQVAGIAPIVLLTQGDPNDIELGRIEAFAASLGADLNSPEIVAQRAIYDAKKAELEALAAEKSDLTVLFASYGSEDRIYVAGPGYVADLGQARDLGVKLANDGSPTSTTYWEELSLEQALYYPSDVIYIDQYGVWTTLEELRAEPTISQHPAVKAGQTGPWMRDLPVNYQGLTAFLESVLGPLRSPGKVS
ncbi:MAG: ABC transporter substrate-binding protein [Thermomicrobiales bacterium]